MFCMTFKSTKISITNFIMKDILPLQDQMPFIPLSEICDIKVIQFDESVYIRQYSNMK